ncbi:MAG: hypothetical protein AAB930_03245, partial [Patescibacteria group bacterium]
FMLLISGGLLIVIGTLSYIAYDAVYNSNENSAAALGHLVIVVLSIFVIVGIVRLLAWIEEKISWFSYINSALLVLFFSALGVALPIYLIHDHYVIGYGASALIYLKWIGVGLAVIAGAVLLIWAAFKYLPALKNTWVGYALLAAKKELCPQLIACPVSADLPASPAREGA